MITPEAQRRYMYDAKFHAVAHTFAMVMEQGNTTTEDATLALEVALSLVAHWRWERPGATKPDPIPGAPMPKGYAEATGRTIAHDGSGIGKTVVADETVELCHAKDPHSPRVCIRAKGHSGEHEDIAFTVGQRGLGNRK